MKMQTPNLGIIPNLCVDLDGWSHTEDAQRVASSISGVLSERGFTGWASGPIGYKELIDEYNW